MINKINTASVNNINSRQSKSDPNFKGGPIDALIAGLQVCEKSPMMNVAVLDLATAIVPRTVVEGETNPYAGFEAFRRESSGLIINCMIPGVIVAGIAKAIQGPIMGAGSKMSNCLANEDTINLVTDYWKKAEGATDREKVSDTIRKILLDTRGIDGEKTVHFKDVAAKEDFETSIKILTDKALQKGKYTRDDRKAIANAYSRIVEKTHVSENIKIGKDAKGYFSQNLKAVMDNTPRILRELVDGKNVDVSSFAAKAKRLLNTKSLLGLGVIIPLALSAQPINRWITAKTSGKKGAPIYKDFSESESKVLSSKEKAALFKQKLISVGSMVGVALLSMGGKLPRMKVLQFKSLFPTMDQARIISTATFASRMMASEDKNDLREATVRDIATFSAFYFLGDYVSQGIATLIQKRKPEIKLLNVTKELKPNANSFDKLAHWIKDVKLKSSDEVVGATAKRMRSVCQLGNLGFSLVALGLLIPMMNRKKTNKKREEELKQKGVDQKTIDKFYPHFAMENVNISKK